MRTFSKRFGQDKVKISNYNRTTTEDGVVEGDGEIVIFEQLATNKFVVGDVGGSWQETMAMVNKDPADLEPGEFRIVGKKADGTEVNVIRIHARALRGFGGVIVTAVEPVKKAPKKAEKKAAKPVAEKIVPVVDEPITKVEEVVEEVTATIEDTVTIIEEPVVEEPIVDEPVVEDVKPTLTPDVDAPIERKTFKPGESPFGAPRAPGRKGNSPFGRR